MGRDGRRAMWGMQAEFLRAHGRPKRARKALLKAAGGGKFGKRRGSGLVSESVAEAVGKAVGAEQRRLAEVTAQLNKAAAARSATPPGGAFVVTWDPGSPGAPLQLAPGAGWPPVSSPAASGYLRKAADPNLIPSVAAAYRALAGREGGRG